MALQSNGQARFYGEMIQNWIVENQREDDEILDVEVSAALGLTSEELDMGLDWLARHEMVELTWLPVEPEW